MTEQSDRCQISRRQFCWDLVVSLKWLSGFWLVQTRRCFQQASPYRLLIMPAPHACICGRPETCRYRARIRQVSFLEQLDDRHPSLVPKWTRCLNVSIAPELLLAPGLRSRTPSPICCPGCGVTGAMEDRCISVTGRSVPANCLPGPDPPRANSAGGRPIELLDLPDCAGGGSSQRGNRKRSGRYGDPPHLAAMFPSKCNPRPDIH